mmetsp:Transcript_19441/g.31990  ORF Transcript_19441/g.31990 Transcript_19441/m.31990 type:complete len:477 (-) Transcript_19441:84-1514(-)
MSYPILLESRFHLNYTWGLDCCAHKYPPFRANPISLCTPDLHPAWHLQVWFCGLIELPCRAVCTFECHLVSMGDSSRNGYDPSLLDKLWIVIAEQLFCLWILFKGSIPFVADIIDINLFQTQGDRLPDNIGGLLDPKLFSKLSGKDVVKVEYSERLEQHANSTDRAWFRVRYKGDKDDSYVFAKVQAKTFVVRAMMSIFDVYRNELHTYSNVQMPVQIPRVHIAKWSRSRFCLAMEDLRKEGATMPNIWETTLDIDKAQKVLSTLAVLHAKFWENPPRGCWNDDSRPYQGKVMGMVTLLNVEKQSPGLIPSDIHTVFMTALWHWDKVRDFYSRCGPKTMVHGDTHLGNFYFTKDGRVGTFDFQVNSEEHFMRDVTYFLCSSYPKERLAQDEKALITYYLSELKRCGVPPGSIPTFEDCWLQYRMQAFYTLYAFVFSGGFSDLMGVRQTRCGVERIVAQMKRVNAAGALYDLLDGKI